MDTMAIEQYLPQVFQLRKKGMEISQISIQLQEQNIPAEMVTEIIARWKQLYYAKKRNEGFVYVGTGTALMIISFLLSVFLFYADKNIEWALYGLTFVGLSLTFKGMIDILGW